MKLFADISEDASGAVFSSDRLYRYMLWRRLEHGRKSILFVGLNPSTADENRNDPTIRRCIGFAREWGFGTLYVANLFAFRATKPDDLRKAIDPVGPENDRWLREISATADMTLAAWGNDGLWLERDRVATPLLISLKCLGLTKLGAPRHPLYVSKQTKPLGFSGAGGDTQ